MTTHALTGNEQAILQATLSLVSRYGMAKTNVGDIAKEAGLSRQTVYNQFENKTEIFRAAIAYFGEQFRKTVKQRLPEADGLSDQLDIIFEEFTIKGYKFSRTSPETHDMVNGSHAVASDILKASFAANRDIIADILCPFESQLAKKGLSAKSLADQLEHACRGYKRDAHSLKHLNELLATQKRMILMAIA